MSKKTIDPKQVEEFLVLNPDFLSNNSHILNSIEIVHETGCLLYTSPSPRDATLSRMPSSA